MDIKYYLWIHLNEVKMRTAAENNKKREKMIMKIATK